MQEYSTPFRVSLELRETRLSAVKETPYSVLVPCLHRESKRKQNILPPPWKVSLTRYTAFAWEMEQQFRPQALIYVLLPRGFIKGDTLDLFGLASHCLDVCKQIG